MDKQISRQTDFVYILNSIRMAIYYVYVSVAQKECSWTLPNECLNPENPDSFGP